jgi:hypothetical protein
VIVLRVTVGTATAEFRSDRAHVLLGSSSAADLRRKDAGWRGREATLLHAETHVLLSRPGRPGKPVPVRVGDVVHLGNARVALVGLLPRTAPAPAAAAASAVLFGGYEDVPATATSGATGAPPADPPPADRAAVAGVLSGHDTVGEALYVAVRRSPFYLASLAFHALLILTILVTKPGPPSKPEEKAREVALSLESPVVSDETVDVGPSAPPLAVHDLEIPEIDFPEETPPESPVPETRETLPVLGSAEGEDYASPMDVGLTPRLSAIGAQTPRRRVPTPQVNLAEPFKESEAAAATDRAAGLIRAEIGTGKDGHAYALDRMRKEDLLVVRGGFDHIGRVLDALKLPYTLVLPHQVAHAKGTDLQQHKVVFWNCGEASPRDQQNEITRKVRQFVERGGYLFCTDWAVAHLVVPAFPGFVGTSGRDNPLPETVVAIEPDEQHAGDPLLDGVFRPGVNGSWWLEQASFDLKVLKSDVVDVLVRSPELKQRFGRGDAVAVTFPYGRGRVLHVLGHYFQKQGDLAGTVAAQRLALNFVLQRLAQN